MNKWFVIVGVVLSVFVALVPVGQAAPLRQARAIINYPTDGMTVSGEVEVKGIATHPNLDFYQLRYAPGPEPTGDSQWVDFALVEGQGVENDVLGTWDTTQIPDGQYTLALAVWGSNDSASPYVFFVNSVTVNNAQPVASPTPAQTPTPQEAPPTPTQGPTPTPVTVEQPATSTPRPTETPLVEDGEVIATPASDDDDGLDMALNFGQVREAFCNGGLITLSLLALWGVYVFSKTLIRWYLRQRTEPPME
jgi:hypothetical protein